MKTTLSVYEIADLLKRDENAGWSYNGAQALAEVLNDSMPEDEEFDRVAIRCDFSEYTSALEAAAACDYEAEEREDEDGEGEEWEDEDGKGEDEGLKSEGGVENEEREGGR